MQYTYSPDGKNIRAWSGLAWADFDRSGKLLRQNPQNPSWVCGEMAEDALREASEAIKTLLDAPIPGDVYLRFNDLPEGGRSKNFSTGELEVGVSCYTLRWDLVGQCYKRTGGDLDGAMIAYAIQGAPMYLVSGTECGTGSDGEPVITGAKILSKLKFDSKKDGYIVK